LKNILILLFLLILFSCGEYKQQEYIFTVKDITTDKIIYTGTGYGYLANKKFASDLIELIIYKNGNSVIFYGNNIMIIQEKIINNSF